MPKYYFEAPTFVINPDSPIAPKLGSIFSKPGLDRLTAPLNQDNLLYIPESTINRCGPFPFAETVSKRLAVAFGINFKAALLGETNIIYRFTSNRNVTYRAHGLETIEFDPTDDFVRDAVSASQKVQQFLDASLAGRKKVYMVTGLKIATGFSQVRANSQTHGPGVAVSADGGLMGVPGIEAGPRGDLQWGRERIGTQGGSSANKIVFAYRVVVVRRKRDGEVAFGWKSGGKYSVGGEEKEYQKNEEERAEDEANDECVVVEVDDETLIFEDPAGFFRD
ncbi:hypothetical protein QBC38DRAFT_38104 [Podospora fimiseda]|uniref:Uncharacterized protein n=1 Tax=Podospora fimiseda TaxID=252190 RepID=A0AAN7BIF5_9PEZI|nr:hypothetical protein QBC38DRAFT_38104 [Podospora fimiseda]